MLGYLCLASLSPSLPTCLATWLRQCLASQLDVPVKVATSVRRWTQQFFSWRVLSPMRARSVAGLVLLSCRMRPHLFPSCTTRLSRLFCGCWDVRYIEFGLSEAHRWDREGFLCIPLSSPLCLRLHSWLCCSPCALWFSDDFLGSPSFSFVLELTAGDTQATDSCCT